MNKTIVFVTHDMDEAIKLADRIVILKAERSFRPALLMTFSGIRLMSLSKNLSAKNGYCNQDRILNASSR